MSDRMQTQITGRVGCETCGGGGEVPVIDGLTHLCECAVQIDWDGRTVWVNNHQGMAIGRYSAVAGVDIHGTFEIQVETGRECLDCQPGVTGDKGWKMFVDGMLKHHRIEVPAGARPADDDRWEGMIEHPSGVPGS